MEISSQIKQRRTAAGISQEELADLIFISRQTLSNWETGKTYPDINSLLRLSEVFHVSLDELVKGDIKAMQEQIKKEDIEIYRRETKHLKLAAVAALGSFILSLFWDSMIANLLYYACNIGASLLLFRVCRLNERNDIQTYREIKAFLEGKRLDEMESAVEKAKRPYQIWLLILVLFALGTVSGILMPPLIAFLCK